MLVLTRKTDEQIMIGDDIKITLVRIRNNSVRLGIEAPRDIRIIRGELDVLDGPDGGKPLSEREEAFADPAPPVVKTGRRAMKAGSNPASGGETLVRDESDDTANRPSILVGRVIRAEDDSARRRRAPLSGFMSAS